MPAVPALDGHTALAAPLPALGEWLTVERTLWAGLLLVAAALRLWDLGGEPLQAAEAAKALAAWQLVQGQGGAIGSPLLGYGGALLFFAFGDNDSTARLLPALAGILLVALPLLLRKQLGRWGALAAAALLTFSPTLLYLARLVDSQSLAAAAGLAVVACLAGLGIGGGTRRYYAVAVALGLLVLTGRDAYTMLLVLAIGALGWLSKAGGRGEKPRLPAGSLLRSAALVAGAVAVLGTTGLLTNLHGFQDGLVAPLEAWLVGLRGAGQPWHFQLQILAAYEPLLLVFGLAGGLAALRHGNRLGRFLVLWALVALVFSSLSGERPGAGIALALVPLALLAGPQIVRLWTAVRAAVPGPALGIFLGVLLSLLTLFWLATQFFTMPEAVLPPAARLGPFLLPLQTVGSVLLPVQAILLVAALFGLAAWIGAQHLPGLVGVLALVVLSAVTLHSAALLGYATNATPAELPVPGRTAADVRTLAGDVGDIVDALAANDQVRGVRLALPAEDDARALLRWYLRRQRGLGLGARPLVNEGLIVAPANADPPPGRFAAQRYRLRSAWASGPVDVARFWRWLTLREAPGPLWHEDVMLYVKA